MPSALLLTLPLLAPPVTSSRPLTRPPAISYLPREPAPLDEPPELARRLLELGADVAWGLPHCADALGDGCAALRGGAEFSLFGLVRPVPHFAVGATARLGRFSAVAEDGSESSAQASFVGLAARVYALESGHFDPYLELDLGAGSVSLDVFAESSRHERAPLLPGVRSALGLDWALTSWFRCGAFLAYSQYSSGSVSRCAAGGCTALSATDSSLVRGSTSLGISLGFRTAEML